MCYQVTIWGSNLVLKYYEPFYQKELQTLMSQKYRFGAQQWCCEAIAVGMLEQSPFFWGSDLTVQLSSRNAAE